MVESMRLQVIMARLGIASRRVCERYIEERRVRLNGKIVNRRGIIVSINDEIEIDDKKIETNPVYHSVAFNKPKKIICSSNDPYGRKSALEFIQNKYPYCNMFTVGRLDFHSTGLLIITNDGLLAKIVQDPYFGVEKEYIVKTYDVISRSFLRRFQNGLQINGTKYCLKRWILHSSYKASLILNEGKNREIRTVFANKSIRIHTLHRVRIGHKKLGDIAPGRWVPLSSEEIKLFYQYGSSIDK